MKSELLLLRDAGDMWTYNIWACNLPCDMLCFMSPSDYVRGIIDVAILSHHSSSG